MAKTIKGYTVHLEANGKSACGTTPKYFFGQIGMSRNPRRVTCPRCEKLAKASR